MSGPKKALGGDAPKPNNGPLAVAFSLLLIFGGCALNNLALEFIIRCDHLLQSRAKR